MTDALGLGGFEPGSSPPERRAQFDLRRRISTAETNIATNAADIAALEARVGVTATRSTTQAFSATTLTDVTYTGETEDTDGFFTATSSTITVPTGKGGLYIVTFVVSLSVAPSLSLYLYANGGVIGQGAGSNAGTGVLTMLTPLAAGDTVKSAIYGSSGGNINSASLRCYKVAP